MDVESYSLTGVGHCEAEGVTPMVEIWLGEVC